MARRRVRDVLAQWGTHPDVVQDAVLTVSELVGNAVVHGDGPDVVLTVRLAASRLRVEVEDGGRGWSAGLPGSCAADAEHGRGLLIVSCVAVAWGAAPSPAACGSLVWAELRWRRTTSGAPAVRPCPEAAPAPPDGPAPAGASTAARSAVPDGHARAQSENAAVAPRPRPAMPEARYALRGVPLLDPGLPSS